MSARIWQKFVRDAERGYHTPWPDPPKNPPPRPEVYVVKPNGTRRVVKGLCPGFTEKGKSYMELPPSAVV